MGESMIEKIQRIMKRPEQIRNICTSAHIHHGKCISGDSIIMLADGNVKAAKELFEEISKEGEIFKDNED